MSRQIQIRRGTSAEHNNFTGAIGEVTMDTTNNTLHVHDGITVGGHEVLKKNEYLSHITNCVTEIPQHIKLELNSGIVTLKAGSKLYSPNGVGIFDVLTTTSDVTIDGSNFGSQQGVIFYNYTTNALRKQGPGLCLSGDVAPTGFYGNYAEWYDTANNLIKHTSDGGLTWIPLYTFPIAIIKTTNNVITSIEQVFNGFGYMGSTIFALPGVVYLKPTGLNADGTLKSSKQTISEVRINSTARPSITGYVLGSSDANITKSSAQTNWYYDEAINYFVDKTNGDTSYCKLGEFTTNSNDRITSFTPNAAFHAVDYNDFNSLMTNTKPITASSSINSIVTTTGISKNRNGYVKFGNGVIIQWGEVTATGASRTITLPTAFSGVNYMVSLIPEAPSGSLYSLMLSDKTSSTVTVSSTGDAANYSFNWIAVGY